MKHLTNCSRSRCLFVTYFSKFQHQGSMVIFPLHRDLGWLWLYLVKEDVPRMNSLGILWQRNLLLKREYLLLAEVDEHHHRRQLWNPWYCGWSESWAPPQRRKGGGLCAYGCRSAWIGCGVCEITSLSKLEKSCMIHICNFNGNVVYWRVTYGESRPGVWGLLPYGNVLSWSPSGGMIVKTLFIVLVAGRCQNYELEKG